MKNVKVLFCLGYTYIGGNHLWNIILGLTEHYIKTIGTLNLIVRSPNEDVNIHGD